MFQKMKKSLFLRNTGKMKQNLLLKCFLYFIKWNRKFQVLIYQLKIFLIFQGRTRNASKSKNSYTFLYKEVKFLKLKYFL